MWGSIPALRTRPPVMPSPEDIARLMQEAGVPALLVGDSAANVVLGHPTTLPVPLSFMIELTAAVRRGAPLAFLVADMPFGSYAGDVTSAARSVCRMVKLSGCDCVKLEVAAGHASTARPRNANRPRGRF